VAMKAAAAIVKRILMILVFLGGGEKGGFLGIKLLKSVYSWDFCKRMDDRSQEYQKVDELKSVVGEER
jgi:hypothetical protein